MRNRSLFWPFFLIAAGLVWLLIEIRSIPVENLWALMYIWPFFLMAAGVGLILRSRWPVARMLVSGLLVLGMVGAVVFAPRLNWNKAPTWSYFTWTNFNGSVRGSGVVVSETRKVARLHFCGDQLPGRAHHPARECPFHDRRGRG